MTNTLISRIAANLLLCMALIMAFSIMNVASAQNQLWDGKVKITFSKKGQPDQSYVFDHTPGANYSSTVSHDPANPKIEIHFGTTDMESDHLHLINITIELYGDKTGTYLIDLNSNDPQISSNEMNLEVSDKVNMAYPMLTMKGSVSIEHFPSKIGEYVVGHATGVLSSVDKSGNFQAGYFDQVSLDFTIPLLEIQ